MTTLLRPAEIHETSDQLGALARPDVDALNELLRHSIIAAEAYRRIMEIVPRERHVADWIRIRSDHQRAVTMLAVRIRLLGGESYDARRAFRMSALTMYSTHPRAVMSGLLRELIRLEEQLLRQFEELVDSHDLAIDCQDMIRMEFVPMCQEHIATLDRMHEACTD